MMKNSIIVLRVVAFLLIILCVGFIYIGFDKINTYVNGDAYIYLVNGTYFIGYMVLGIGCFTNACIIFLFSNYLTIQQYLIAQRF